MEETLKLALTKIAEMEQRENELAKMVEKIFISFNDLKSSLNRTEKKVDFVENSLERVADSILHFLKFAEKGITSEKQIREYLDSKTFDIVSVDLEEQIHNNEPVNMELINFLSNNKFHIVPTDNH